MKINDLLDLEGVRLKLEKIIKNVQEDSDETYDGCLFCALNDIKLIIKTEVEKYENK